MGCGLCFNVTPTGYSPLGKGTTNLNSVILMVTNLCPDAGWCTAPVNTYGYTAHFDMMDYNMNGIITAQGWDNPEVYYYQVTCPSTQLTDWNGCQCYGQTPAYTGPTGPINQQQLSSNTTNSKTLSLSVSLFLILLLIILNV